MLVLALLAAPLLQGTDGRLGELADSDRAVQLAAIEALASALDHPGPAQEIATALARAAVEGADPAVRRACLEAMGRRGDAASLATLGELLWTLPSKEQVWVTRSLGATPTGRARAWELLVSALQSDAAELPVAELMRVGSTSLAETGGGREWTSAELSPFARLLRSTDPSVSESVLRAVDDLLLVLEQTSGRHALTFLEALDEAGYRADLVADHVCDVGLKLLEAEIVVEAARALCDGTFLELDAASQARGLGYLATARFISGEHEEAAELFLEQRDIADALSRRPLTGRSDLALRSVASQLAATAEVGLALSKLANGAQSGDPEVLGAVRRAHLLALRSHVFSARAGQNSFASLDFLFGAHPAPWRALEGPRPIPGLDADEAMRLRLELLAAFATVAPEEVPGITPLTADDLPRTSEDPERIALISEILDAREERLEEQMEETRKRSRRRSDTGEWGSELDAEFARSELNAEFERLAQEVRNLRLQRREWPIDELLPAVRRASTVALNLAATLREEGRLREARALLESFLEDMETGSLLQRYVWAIQSAARAETNLGSCFCDEDKPEEAERFFLRAVERLEDLENFYASREFSPATYRNVTSMRAGALISLAVNANVRLGDPERALGYFERAYELRQDPFATVLLACYRARSGREAEARVALARVVPEPNLYYNLACTHALLGDTSRALSFLELELSVNHPTRGARERQKAWARDDPDLRSLRDEARFQELTSER